MLTKKIFFCYAHEDKRLLNKLKNHLKPLQRQEFINLWYDGDISAGTEWELEIKEQLNTANVILLLISPDFMASDYCYGVEMQRAIERHERGEATVIPIILRPVHWEEAPFSKLQALPTDAKPVTKWKNQDEALLNIARSIHNSIGEKKVPVVNTPSSTTQTNILPKEPTLPPMQPQPSPYAPISQQQVLYTSATKNAKTRKPKPVEVIIFFNIIFIGALTPMFIVFKFNWLTISIGVLLFILDFFLILGIIIDSPNSRNRKGNM